MLSIRCIRFFQRFIQAYANEGITIHSLTVQNEPLNASNYATMIMTSDQEREFVKRFLGPAFVKNNITTDIIIYDHNWDNVDYALNILSDTDAKKFVVGSAWHCYGGNRTSPLIVKKAHPDRDIYFTECSGGDWSPDFANNLEYNVQILFMSQLRVWARTVLLWNMALDENDGPRFPGLGGCGNCRGVLRTYQNGTYDKNVEFYAIGHFAKFISRGAYVIEAATFPSDQLETVAVENPDGSIVVVVINLSQDNARDFYVQIGKDTYQYKALPTRSVVTMVKNK